MESPAFRRGEESKRSSVPRMYPTYGVHRNSGVMPCHREMGQNVYLKRYPVYPAPVAFGLPDMSARRTSDKNVKTLGGRLRHTLARPARRVWRAGGHARRRHRRAGRTGKPQRIAAVCRWCACARRQTGGHTFGRGVSAPPFGSCRGGWLASANLIVTSREGLKLALRKFRKPVGVGVPPDHLAKHCFKTPLPGGTPGVPRARGTPPKTKHS